MIGDEAADVHIVHMFYIFIAFTFITKGDVTKLTGMNIGSIELIVFVVASNGISVQVTAGLYILNMIFVF